MIPSTRWRPVAGAVVVVADLVVLMLVARQLVDLLLLAIPVLVLSTAWGLRRPGGWGALALVLMQVTCAAAAGRPPDTLTSWALVALTGIAVCASHLALSLLAAWPTRASLPVDTAQRWLRHTALLAWAAIAAAALGAVATRTPIGAGPWVLAAGLVLVAGVSAQLSLARRPR